MELPPTESTPRKKSSVILENSLVIVLGVCLGGGFGLSLISQGEQKRADALNKSAAMLRDYDTNRNGVMDRPELQRYFRENSQ